MDKKYYHRQSQDEWCGPASIQMVLSYLIDQDLSNKFSTSQYEILQAGSITFHNLPWDWSKYSKYFTYPDEVEKGLTHFADGNKSQIIPKPTITNTHKYSTPEDYKDFLQRYLLNLNKYPIVSIHSKLDYSVEVTIPPIYQNSVVQALKIEYAGHWVVITDFQVGNTKDGFLGFDPWLPKLVGTLEIPDNHKQSGDSYCQAVIVHISGEMDVFKKNFPSFARVAIVWKLNNESFKNNDPDTRFDDSPLPGKPSRCSNRQFDATMAQSLFTQMTAFGLRAQLPCADYLNQVTISSGGVPSQFRLGIPRLVRRLDGFCDDYYLVPLLKANGESTVLVRVDAPSGLYLDSLYYSENPLLIDEVPSAVIPTQKDLIEVVVPARLIEMGKKNWVVPFQEQIQNKKKPPEMIWLPCQQSISAFFPFFVFKTGRENFFVRLDGKIYLKLTY